jgi:hypothetical protein
MESYAVLPGTVASSSADSTVKLWKVGVDATNSPTTAPYFSLDLG